MARAVMGLFNTQSRAEQAIRDLKTAGFAERDLGMVSPEQPSVMVREDGATMSTEGAMAGGILGGTLGAILAATGALIIPGVGPFITGGILVTLVGGAAGWLVGGLAGLGVSTEEANYYEQQVQSGRTLVAVRAAIGEEAEQEAVAILSRNGGEISRPAESASPVVQEQETSGMRPAPEMHGDLPEPTMRAAPFAGSAEGASMRPRPDVTLTGPGIRTTALPAPDSARTGVAGGPLMPGNDPSLEATASNPVPLSPTDPNRRTDEGQPALDDANPYGRALANQQNRQMGGVGVLADPVATERPSDQTEQDA